MKWITDSPIPIWRHAGIFALFLERFLEEMYVPAMPGKELPSPMYLKKSTLRSMTSTAFPQTYPGIQVHVEVHYICKVQSEPPHLERRSQWPRLYHRNTSLTH